jgi:hypothetical protein
VNRIAHCVANRGLAVNNEVMAPHQWGVNQIRLTAFPEPSSTVNGADWWQQLTGESPDTTVASPKVASHQTQGSFQDGTLALQIQPLRIDWLHAATAPEGIADFSGTLGPFVTVLPTFLELMVKWLSRPDCPSFLRIALGTVLLMPVDSREAGYERLGAYLPFVKLDTKSSDFSYQINRPRQSNSFPPLLLNRLSKWSVGALQALIASPSGIAIAGRQHHCRLELDINTSAENTKAFSQDSVVKLFHELGELAAEIADKGDIA